MKFSSKLLSASILAGALIAPTAQAEISGNVAIQSDYTWRGVSQNSEDPSIQGGFDYAHESGFYAGVWGASVDFGGPETTEGDLYFGFSGETESGIGYDIGYIEYMYFGGAGASGSDFTEYYVGASYKGFGLTYYVGDEFDDNVEFSYGYDFEKVSVGATYGDYDSYSYYTLGVSGEFAETGLGWDVSYWGTSDLDGLDIADDRVVFTLSKSL
ncbi:MAG: TorF family putative porin [Arenicella sp.]|jgi:uncharacterized protein (TIGR02001 family)|nr:TorF family putative porin [Arenicella sp.]HAU69533.1 hypothetical protein [Gammaproteobacteria bacterium]